MNQTSSAIEAEALGKKYWIGHQNRRSDANLRESILHVCRCAWEKVRQPLAPSRSQVTLEEFWALKDVSFDVRAGNRVGIIGRNGAGKSTLLKILSRITAPTTGSVRVKGQVASLLEVGTGFHPELSGRENIFMNGAILGMSRREIRRKFDEMVAFSGVERFLDTPVKRYSSGMYVRLAFSVAAHLEPDILLVDEVLAVGDSEFQKKCLGKMSEVAKQGRTVLFVSHNMAAIKAICDSGIYLQDGGIAHVGDITSTISAYLNSTETPSTPYLEFPENETLPIQFLSIGVFDGYGHVAARFRYTDPFVIKLRVAVHSRISEVYIAVHVHDRNNLETVLFSRDFETDESRLSFREVGAFTYAVTVPGPLLVPGQYRLSAHIVRFSRPGSTILCRADYVCDFEVFDDQSAQARLGLPWHGKVAVPLDWEEVGGG